MGTAHRFSIDIDIIMPKKPENFSAVLEAISIDGIFLGYEEQKRKSGKYIPKEHYKFFYRSVLSDSVYSILLDVLIEENPYIETKQIPIKSLFIKNIGDPVEVSAPSINCILGDKLTAFAPNTTGIPYRAGKDLEIAKQLFDVSKLFDKFDNISVVRDTFIRIAKKELAYRAMEQLSTIEVLDDIFETSCSIAYGGINMAKDENYPELKSGISKLGSFVYSEVYSAAQGMLSAGKAAYLAMLLKTGDETIGVRFDPEIDLSNVKIGIRDYNSFNKIKKISPEAFFYWYQALSLFEEGHGENDLEVQRSYIPSSHRVN